MKLKSTIEGLISIKDWHKTDLLRSEIECINTACNLMDYLVEFIQEDDLK